MKRIIFILILCMLLSEFVFAGPAEYSVSGKISNIKNNTPVYIFLTDEETSKVPFAGIKEIIITPDQKAVEAGYIEFIISGIPGGKYGIRCFQDANGNGKLDKEMFGPKEPWGLSWNDQKSSGWPSFDNYSFLLNEDIADLTIKLK